MFAGERFSFPGMNNQDVFVHRFIETQGWSYTRRIREMNTCVADGLTWAKPANVFKRTPSQLLSIRLQVVTQ